MIQPLPGLNLLLRQPNALQTGAGVIGAAEPPLGNALRRSAHAKPEKVLHFAVRTLGLRRLGVLFNVATWFAAASATSGAIARG
jgi:hypothetical protein